MEFYSLTVSYFEIDAMKTKNHFGDYENKQIFWVSV